MNVSGIIATEALPASGALPTSSTMCARIACAVCGATVEPLPRPKPPDMDTLMEWEAEGGCEAACPYGCWVEPDGTCPHGHPSWLIVMGLVVSGFLLCAWRLRAGFARR